MAKSDNSSELVQNRKAGHDYEILETFEAGIILLGTEIKSLRNHGGALQDAFVDVRTKEGFWLINSSIAPYSFGNIHNHEEKRPRKLLMHKREMAKIRKSVIEKGLSVIPLSMYLKKGIVKVKIAIVKGKRAYDKRASLKEKDSRRAIARGDF